MLRMVARTDVGLDRKIGRRGGAVVIGLMALLGACRERPTPTPQTGASAPIVAKVDRTYGKLQMSFEPNRGQTDARVSFLSRGGGYSLFLEPTKAVFALRKPSRVPAATAAVGRAAYSPGDHVAPSKAHPGGETSILGMRLVGANAASSVAGESPLPGKVNYYIGNDPKRWLENVPTFGKIRYSGVYPGVDLVYYGTEGRLEYDFVVAPGADPTRIRVAFDGAVPKLTADGEIVLSRGDAEVRLRNLIVYQEQRGIREPVSGRFVLAGDHQVRFAVADYDRGRALVIDPTVVYATYLAGPGQDDLHGLAVDSKGSAVVVGDVQNGGFPVTSGAYQATDPNLRDAGFITKFAPDGSSLVFSTYIGGVGGDYHGGNNGSTHPVAVAIDTQDSIYLTGEAWSTDFPTTAGVVQPLIGGYAVDKQFGGGQGDAFVTKLTATGTLAYSTYLGGDNQDYGGAIAVDAAGDVYIAGNTYSYNTIAPQAPPIILFPTTPGAYEAPFAVPTGGSVSAMPFFAVLNPGATQLLYSSLLGPTACVSQCQDGSSCGASVPCATGSGSCDSYCWHDSPVQSVALGKGGVAYIAGYTSQPNFPTTPGALQPVGRGGRPYIGFIAAFDPAKSGAASLVFSTFLGGTKLSKTLDGDAVFGIAADADGNVYATGQSSSVDFPTTPGTYAPACTASPNDPRCPGTAFVTKLDPTGSKIIYSTFLTDLAQPYGYPGAAIALDSARNAYVFGSGSGVPLVKPVSQTGGVSIQTLSADGSRLLFSTPFTGGLDPAGIAGIAHNGFVVDNAGAIYVAGSNAPADVPVTAGAFQAAAQGLRDSYVLKISPIGAAAPTPDGGAGGAGDSAGIGGAGGGLASGGGTNGAGGADGGGPSGNGGASAGSGSAGKAGASGATGGKGAPGDAGVYKPGSDGGGSGGCSVLPSTFFPPSGTCLMGLLLLALRRRRKSRRDFRP